MRTISFRPRRNQYPLEQLGVEKRSMAGAVLMVPPLVEIGDVSVVEKEGLLESSLSLFSCAIKTQNTVTATPSAPSMAAGPGLGAHLQRFEPSLLLFQGRLLLPLVHFGEGHPRAGQRRHRVRQSARPVRKHALIFSPRCRKKKKIQALRFLMEIRETVKTRRRD